MNNYPDLTRADIFPRRESPPHVFRAEKKITFDIQRLENPAGILLKPEIFPRRLSLFQIIWIQNGAGDFRLDFYDGLIKDNLLGILFPGQIFGFNPSKGVSGYRILFSKEFLCCYDKEIYLPFALDYQCREFNVQFIQPDKSDLTEMEMIMSAMIRENSNNLLFRSEILKSWLEILITYFSGQFSGNQQVGNANDVRLFRNFMEALDCHFATKKSVSDFAEQLTVSPSYLSEVIKKVSGHSASYYIQQRLILEAKRAAVYSDFSMKEISYQLGFTDPSQFSKFFKIKAGRNFSDFKKEIAFSGKSTSRKKIDVCLSTFR